eukprot:s1011_g21.t1
MKTWTSTAPSLLSHVSHTSIPSIRRVRGLRHWSCIGLIGLLMGFTLLLNDPENPVPDGRLGQGQRDDKCTVCKVTDTSTLQPSPCTLSAGQAVVSLKQNCERMRRFVPGIHVSILKLLDWSWTVLWRGTWMSFHWVFGCLSNLPQPDECQEVFIHQNSIADAFGTNFF